MPADRYYDPYADPDLPLPEYRPVDVSDERGWGAGLTGVGTGGMGLAAALATTGVGLIPAGIVAGVSALAMLGGHLLGSSADESAASADMSYNQDMLAWQQAAAEKKTAFMEKQAMRQAKQDALLALKSRNIFV